MLGAEDAMKSATSKRTVCLSDSSKTLGEGPNETLIVIVTIVEEAVAETSDIRDKVR